MTKRTIAIQRNSDSGWEDTDPVPLNQAACAHISEHNGSMCTNAVAIALSHERQIPFTVDGVAYRASATNLPYGASP